MIVAHQPTAKKRASASTTCRWITYPLSTRTSKLLVCGHSQNPRGQAASTNQAFLQDGKNAKLRRAENMNRVRFIEIFLVGSDPTKNYLPTSVYNTVFSPGFDPIDFCINNVTI